MSQVSSSWYTEVFDVLYTVLEIIYKHFYQIDIGSVEGKQISLLSAASRERYPAKGIRKVA